MSVARANDEKYARVRERGEEPPTERHSIAEVNSPTLCRVHVTITTAALLHDENSRIDNTDANPIRK